MSMQIICRLNEISYNYSDGYLIFVSIGIYVSHLRVVSSDQTLHHVGPSTVLQHLMHLFPQFHLEGLLSHVLLLVLLVFYLLQVVPSKLVNDEAQACQDIDTHDANHEIWEVNQDAWAFARTGNAQCRVQSQNQHRVDRGDDRSDVIVRLDIGLLVTYIDGGHQHQADGY